MYRPRQMNLLSLMPFYECTDYELSEIFVSCKYKIQKIIRDRRFDDIIKSSTSLAENGGSDAIRRCNYYSEYEVSIRIIWLKIISNAHSKYMLLIYVAFQNM